MALTVSTNDSVATRACRSGEVSQVQMDSKECRLWADDKGHVATVGRGESDVGITYLSLRNTNGTEIFVYPNAAGNGVIVTSTKP